MNSSKKHIPVALLAVWISVLSGCGGGSEESAAVTDTFHAYNGLATTRVDTPVEIDLTPYVQGEQVVLSDVTPKTVTRMSADGHCGVDDFDAETLQATLVMTQAGRCDYQYTVTNNHGEKASATLTLVTSSLPDPTLPPVSFPVSPKETAIPVDLSNLLGAGAIPAGFELDDALFTTQPSPGSVDIDLASIVKTGPTAFTFNAPDSLGWNKISYAVKKSGATPAEDEVLVGLVFVSISDSFNTPPTITPLEATYPEIIVVGESVEVDVERLFWKQIDRAMPGIAKQNWVVTDALDCMNKCRDVQDFYCTGMNLNKHQSVCSLYDSEETPVYDFKKDYFSRIVTTVDAEGPWRITALESFGAQVEVSDANDGYNTKFKFQANKAGTYHVAYIVTDYDGGSALGVLKFQVESTEVETNSGWQEIPHDNKIYSAPLTRQQAEQYGVAGFAQETIYGKNFQVARFTFDQAVNYCSTLGARLPTTVELESLRHASGEAATLLDWWPKVESLYWALDGDTEVIHSLMTGTTLSSIQNYPAYTTCILEPYAFHGVFEYNDDNIDTTADALYAGGTTTLTVTVTDRATGTPKAGAGVEASASSDSSISCPNTTDADGQVECTVSSTLAGTAAYTLDYTIDGDQYYSRHVTPVVAGAAADIKRFDYALVGTKRINVFRAVDQYGNLAEVKNLPVSITFKNMTGDWWINNVPVVLGETYEYQTTNEWGFRTDSVDDSRTAEVALNFNSTEQITNILGVKDVQTDDGDENTTGDVHDGNIYDFTNVTAHLKDVSVYHGHAAEGELFKIFEQEFTTTNFKAEVRRKLDEVNRRNVSIVNTLTGARVTDSSVSGSSDSQGNLDFNGLDYADWFHTNLVTVSDPKIDPTYPIVSSVKDDDVKFIPRYYGRALIATLGEVLPEEILSTPATLREHQKQLLGLHDLTHLIGVDDYITYLYSTEDNPLPRAAMFSFPNFTVRDGTIYVGDGAVLKSIEPHKDHPIDSSQYFEKMKKIKHSNCSEENEVVYWRGGSDGYVIDSAAFIDYGEVATIDVTAGTIQGGEISYMYTNWAYAVSTDLNNPREGICENSGYVQVLTLTEEVWEPELPDRSVIIGTHSIGLEHMIVGVR